jgi:uncharacterized protein YcbK (DUF882 family)
MAVARTRLVLLVPGREAISLDLHRLLRQAVLLLFVAPLLLGIGARSLFDGLVGSAPFGFVLVPSEATGSLVRVRPSLRIFEEARAAPPPRPTETKRTARLGALRADLTVSAAAVLRAFGVRRAPLQPDAPELWQGPLRMTASHLGESVRVIPFGPDGAADPQAFAALAHLMRCRITGEEVPIEPALVRVLVALGNTYRRPLLLISGHRTAHVNGTSETSQHTSGRAADIKVAGIGIEELRKKAFELGARGVGLYPEKGFVHIDVRPKRKHSWVYTEAEGEQPYVGQSLVRVAATAAVTEIETGLSPVPPDDRQVEGEVPIVR